MQRNPNLAREIRLALLAETIAAAEMAREEALLLAAEAEGRRLLEARQPAFSVSEFPER